MSRIMMAVALMFVGAACGLPGFPGRNQGAAAAQPDSVVVEVLNENYYATRIHAVFDGGQRRALGTIAGNGGRARVGLAWEPKSLVFEVQLIVDGSAYVSHPVYVSPGDSIEVRVPSNISGSGFFRRVRD